LQWRRRQALPLARRRRRVIILMLRRPPAPPLFPYTTLFRSQSRARDPNGTARCARGGGPAGGCRGTHRVPRRCASVADPQGVRRSEEHTSELQSRENLVCRLLLEKKNIKVQNLRSRSGRNTT